MLICEVKSLSPPPPRPPPPQATHSGTSVPTADGQLQYNSGFVGDGHLCVCVCACVCVREIAGGSQDINKSFNQSQIKTSFKQTSMDHSVNYSYRQTS